MFLMGGQISKAKVLKTLLIWGSIAEHKGVLRLAHSWDKKWHYKNIQISRWFILFTNTKKGKSVLWTSNNTVKAVASNFVISITVWRFLEFNFNFYFARSKHFSVHTVCYIGRVEDILQKATVPLMSKEECQARYRKRRIGDKVICAGYDTGGRDACKVMKRSSI